jgi:hypothetical protein
MSRVTLLMITYNRREYTRMALERLLAGAGDFAVWIWDNGSTDGTADLVRAVKSHPRVHRVHLSPENVLQTPPFDWLLRDCQSPLVGKVDNDCLMPARWVDPIARALNDEPRLAVIGCWTFWPDDFDPKLAAHKIRRFGDHHVLTNAYIGGTGLLVRSELARRFWMPRPNGMPINQYAMSAAGLVNGWYYPLIWAEHMDDPRSEYCTLRQPDGMNETYALTAQLRGHRTPEQYERWIRQDCARILSRTTEEQLREWRRERLRSAPRAAARAARRLVRRLWDRSTRTAAGL